jgi:hypothetical protein
MLRLPLFQRAEERAEIGVEPRSVDATQYSMRRSATGSFGRMNGTFHIDQGSGSQPVFERVHSRCRHVQEWPWPAAARTRAVYDDGAGSTSARMHRSCRDLLISDAL